MTQPWGEVSTLGTPIYEARLVELQAALATGDLSSLELVEACLERIAALDQAGPCLRAVLELNPAAREQAQTLDAERAAGQVRGPLHGVPILLKDNLDTDDAMLTTAGSLALVSSRPAQEATVVSRLRAAGAVILGKTNLSEWANFRASGSSSGWSARGGRTRNPYVLDRNPCGSSSGSAVAVAASLCAVALGSETDGSIVCPSSLCGVVGLKPTVGLVSRAGVIPISPTQDTVGPHARTVADAAVMLGVIAGPDPRDPATALAAQHAYTDYTQFLHADGLRGARLGVLRDEGTVGYNQHADAVLAQALQALHELGASLVDPLHLAPRKGYLEGDEFTVLLHEFKVAIAEYLATRQPHPAHPGAPIPRTLADLIAFNRDHAAQELAYFGQELFELAEATTGLADPAYQEALTRSRDGSRELIDQALATHQLDAIIAITMQPAWTTDLLNGDRYRGGSSSYAARAGYPLITVPAGSAFGLPVGLTFMGGAWSEPTLLRLAYAFEQGTQVRQAPAYRVTL
ncbi:MAG: amidase [Oscillochloridaceae bacterium umkhey_bin13]